MEFKKVYEETKRLYEAADPLLQKAAAAVKGKAFFNMRQPLEVAFGRGKVDSNYQVWSIKTPKGTIGITSTHNADAGSEDIVQDGFVIGWLSK